MPSYSKIALVVGLVMVLVACGGDKSESTQAPTSSNTSTQAAPAPTVQPAPATQDESVKEAAQAGQPTESAADSQAKSEPKETNDKNSNTQAAALPPDAGQKRYDATCKICHDQGLLDSPKLSDKANWQPRIAQGKEVLYEHSIKGFNKMPAQAVNGVSEEEVKAAVDYMVAKASS